MTSLRWRTGARLEDLWEVRILKQLHHFVMPGTGEREVLRALQDGDLVAVHSRVVQRPRNRGAALVHIFRFESGRIAELWDGGQPVPEDSPNEHGMF